MAIRSRPIALISVAENATMGVSNRVKLLRTFKKDDGSHLLYPHTSLLNGRKSENCKLIFGEPSRFPAAGY